MDERKVSEFKNACRVCLITFDLTALRAYGRSLQLKEPTKLQKSALIEEIIRALCGETKPQRSKRGAPTKNNFISPALIEQIENLQAQYLFQPIAQEAQETPLQKIQEPQVQLQFSIQPSSLNKKQKRLLNDFLNSL